MKTKSKHPNMFNLKFLNPIIFFKENMVWFKFVSIVFGLAFIGGAVTYFYPQLNIFYPLIKAAFNDLATVAESLKDATFFEKAWTIFLNNITIAGLILVSGLVLGILPLFIIVLNGLVLGFFSMMILFSNFSIFIKIIMIITLIPHGIIELYSIFTASAYSLKLGIGYLLPEAKGKRIKVLFKNLKSAPTIFVFVILGLTFASIIEVFDMIILKVLVK